MKGRKTGGRTRGVPNKATGEVRAVIADLAKATAPRLASWLDEIDDPAKRFDLFLKMLEYDLPKLQRTELTGPDGGAVIIQSTPADDRL